MGTMTLVRKVFVAMKKVYSYSESFSSVSY